MSAGHRLREVAAHWWVHVIVTHDVPKLVGSGWTQLWQWIAFVPFTAFDDASWSSSCGQSPHRTGVADFRVMWKGSFASFRTVGRVTPRLYRSIATVEGSVCKVVSARFPWLPCFVAELLEFHP
jgi:hypothetical protein